MNKITKEIISILAFSLALFLLLSLFDFLFNDPLNWQSNLWQALFSVTVIKLLINIFSNKKSTTKN